MASIGAAGRNNKPVDRVRGSYRICRGTSAVLTIPQRRLRSTHFTPGASSPPRLTFSWTSSGSLKRLMVAASVNAPPKPIISCSFSSVSTTTVPHSPFCGQRALSALSSEPLLLPSPELLLSSSSLSAAEVHSCKHDTTASEGEREAKIEGTHSLSLEL